MTDEPLYSTATGSNKGRRKDKSNWQAGSGACRMRLETKGRGGKVVTVLFNLPLSEAEAKRLMKEIQAVAACGATLKNSTIELRGDVRDKVESFLQGRQIKVVRAGG